MVKLRHIGKRDAGTLRREMKEVFGNERMGILFQTIVSAETGQELTLEGLTDATIAYIAVGDFARVSELYDASNKQIDARTHDLVEPAAIAGYNRSLDMHLGAVRTSGLAIHLDSLVTNHELIRDITGIPVDQEMHELVFLTIAEMEELRQITTALTSYIEKTGARPPPEATQMVYDAVVTPDFKSTLTRVEKVYRLTQNLPRINGNPVNVEDYTDYTRDEKYDIKSRRGFTEPMARRILQTSPEKYFEDTKKALEHVKDEETRNQKSCELLLKRYFIAADQDAQVPQDLTTDFPQALCISITNFGGTATVDWYARKLLGCLSEKKIPYNKDTVKEEIEKGLKKTLDEYFTHPDKVRFLRRANMRSLFFTQLAITLEIVFAADDPLHDSLQQLIADSEEHRPSHNFTIGGHQREMLTEESWPSAGRYNPRFKNLTLPIEEKREQ
jgi:hypothetical protein